MENSNLVGRLIVASASPWMANCHWKGRGQIHVSHFKFWRPNDISGTAEASFGLSRDIVGASKLFFAHPLFYKRRFKFGVLIDTEEYDFRHEHWQTSPGAAIWQKLDETYVFSLILAYFLYYMKTWRHPQNGKYVTRRMEPQPQVTCIETLVKFRLWLLRYASVQTDKQTDRQRYTLITILRMPTGDERTKAIKNRVNTVNNRGITQVSLTRKLCVRRRTRITLSNSSVTEWLTILP